MKRKNKTSSESIFNSKSMGVRLHPCIHRCDYRVFVFTLLIYDTWMFLKCCHQESWQADPRSREFNSKDVKHSERTCEVFELLPTLCQRDWPGIKWPLCSIGCFSRDTGDVCRWWRVRLGDNITTSLKWEGGGGKKNKNKTKPQNNQFYWRLGSQQVANVQLLCIHFQSELVCLCWFVSFYLQLMTGGRWGTAGYRYGGGGGGGQVGFQ